MYGFRSGVELVGLADRPTGCGEVARGGCAVAWNVRVTRSTVLRKTEGRHWTNQYAVCISDSLLAYCLKIPQTKIRELHYRGIGAPEVLSYPVSRGIAGPHCLWGVMITKTWSSRLGVERGTDNLSL